jgi:exodeoxyribonuclease V beta subunit
VSVVRYRKPTVLGQLPAAGPVVVEASAGTGKTYTLEHLIIDLLLRDDATTIDQILVVTFTERATSEMRQRVRDALERLLHVGTTERTPRIHSAPSAGGGGGAAEERGPAAPAEPRTGPPEPDDCWVIDDRARARLARALQDFDSATIATIHAFCQRVLHEHAFLHRRLLRQELVDGRAAFGRAFRAEVRERFARDPALQPWLRAGLGALGDLDALAGHLHDCARRPGTMRPDFDPAALERALAAFPLADAEDPGLRAAMDAALGGRTGKAVAERLVRVGRVVRDWQAHRDLPRVLVDLEALEGAYKSNPPFAYVTASFGARALPAGPAPRLRDGLAALRAAFVPVLAAVTARLLEPVRERVRRAKRDEGQYDFDDMLALVAEGLRGPGGDVLRDALRRRYRHALIDEFQDTDEIQWDIFQRLFLGRDDGGQLFLIGDPKQAIYGFRGADVDTYVRARAALAARGVAPVALVPNFRSTAPLLRALNLVLDQQAAAPVFSSPDIRYDDPVTCGDEGLAATDPAGAPVPPLVLFELSGSATKPARVQGLGAQIAAEIRRLIGPEAPLRFTRKRDGYAPRPIRPGDVFVLTRTTREGQEIGAVLRAHGLPHAYYKEEGLFGRPEARDVLDLLFAVAAPRSRAFRLRAWLTPFFGLTMAEARRCREVPDTDPLMRRLLDWHELAARHDYERLFARILGDSGLVRRELFLHDQERALTNYLHLFELLLEEARRGAAPPLELARQLQGYVDGTRTPPGDEGDVQRLESDADAVQIMTMHKAKGLEAPVVFLAGGFAVPPSGEVRTFHDAGERCSWIGTTDVPAAVEQAIAREEREADERLVYVAITRAQARLYLPYYPPGLEPKGYRHTAIARLNDRLRELEPRFAELAAAGLLAREPVVCAEGEPAAAPVPAPAAAPFAPPPALLEEPAAPLPFAELRRAHRGFVVTSYSALKRAEAEPRYGADAARLRPEEEGDPSRADAAGAGHAAPAPGDLPGGAATGIYLHEVLEQADLAGVAAAASLDAWRASPGVAELFQRHLHGHGLDARHVPRAQELVYAALTAPVVLAAPPATQPALRGLAAAAAQTREMEFIYPLPERSHPPLELPGGPDPAPLTVERGFVQGFVDYLFLHEGRAYLVDWKSDLLRGYGWSDLEPHVRASYGRQEQLYSLALCRLLGVRDAAAYEACFGGVLYCFLRGMARAPVGSEGVWFGRPPWSQIVAWDEELRALPAARLWPGEVAP